MPRKAKPKKIRKIALIGTGRLAETAPYDDPDYEIWGVASRLKHVTRADRWFELHRLDGEPKSFQDNWRKDIKRWSKEVELYMLYPEPNLGPRVIPYPYQRIVDRFGTFFMTSSFSWMMALAIDELRPEDGEPVPGELSFWGVDMEYGTEYRHQRVGFRHFIDVARVLNITVTRFADSGLSYEPVPYPMWQDDPLQAKLTTRHKEALDKLADYNESIRHTRTLIAQNQALIEEVKKMGNGYDAANRLASLEREHLALLETSSQISKDIVHWTAIEEEQRYWRDYLSP